jgi:hypothetical protein
MKVQISVYVKKRSVFVCFKKPGKMLRGGKYGEDTLPGYFVLKTPGKED